MELKHRIVLAGLLAGAWGSFTRRAGATEIPVNIGVGPAAYYVPEKLQEEDPEPFYGLKLHIKAVIDKELIKKHKNKIPAQYQKSLEKVDEIRVGYLLIPESIMLGTRRKEHGPEFFGATWRPIGLNIPVKMGPARLAIGTGLLITYAFVNTGNYKIVDNAKELEEGTAREPEYRDQVTHFLRPGMDLNADFEVKFTESFLMSMGWSSAYYIPQKIGGGIGTLGADDLERSLWRIHQAYVMAHYRIPVTVRL
jgi:hypothetical protein